MATALWYAWRATLRRATGRIALGVLVGLAVAAVAIPVAGARRTATVHDRVSEAYNIADLRVDGGDEAGVLMDTVGELPGIEDSAWVTDIVTLLLGPPADVQLRPPGASIQVTDDRFGTEVSRHVVVSGRLPDPNRLEAVASQTWAKRFATGLGEAIVLTLPTDQLLHDIQDNDLSIDEWKARIASDPTMSRSVTATVVGVVLPASEIAADDQDRPPTLFVTPAVRQALGLPEPTAGVGHLSLATDTEPALVRQQLEEVQEASAASNAPVDLFSFEAASDDRARVDRAIRAHVTVLWVLAVLAAALGVVVVVPTVRRQVVSDSRQDLTFTALGFTRRDRSLLGSLLLVPTAVTAVITAVVLTMIASRWFPIGPVRPYEPAPGIRPDWPVLTMAIVGAGLAVLALGAVRTRRGRRPPARLDRGIGRRLSTSDIPLPAAIGAHLAMPRDSLKPMMRTSILTLAVGVIVAAAVFWTAAGFNRLADEPARHGWAWDVALINERGFRAIDPPLTDTLLAGAGAVEWTYVTFAEVRSGDVDLPGFGLQPGHGSVEFTVLEGRMPDGPDEVALGTTSFDRLGVSIGDLLPLDGDRGVPRAAVVVGRVVLPALAPTDGPRPQLGSGAVMTFDGLSARRPDDPEDQLAPSAAIVVAGPTGAAELEQRILQRLPAERSLVLLRDQLSGELRAWRDDLSQTPLIAAVGVFILLSGVLLHTLNLTLQRRQVELAILRTLGVTARQAGWAVAGETLWITTISIAIGIPLGALAGTVAWYTMAQNFGVADDLVWPSLNLWALLGLLVLAAGVISWRRNRQVQRSSIADALRAE